jgi:hypothetical protein
MTKWEPVREGRHLLRGTGNWDMTLGAARASLETRAQARLPLRTRVGRKGPGQFAETDEDGILSWGLVTSHTLRAGLGACSLRSAPESDIGTHHKGTKTQRG